VIAPDQEAVRLAERAVVHAGPFDDPDAQQLQQVFSVLSLEHLLDSHHVYGPAGVTATLSAMTPTARALVVLTAVQQLHDCAWSPAIELDED